MGIGGSVHCSSSSAPVCALPVLLYQCIAWRLVRVLLVAGFSLKHACKIHLACLLCALRVSHLMQCVLYYSDHFTVLEVRERVVRVVMERDRVL